MTYAVSCSDRETRAMAGDDTLAKALADVRQRRIDLQSEHDRIVTELSRLRTAEKSLAAIVEGGVSDDDIIDGGASSRDERDATPRRAAGRGSRGPRANSAKGRLKALLEQTGLQGLTHAELERRLPDVAPNTLNTYLSMMVTGGEAIRKGDFYVSADPSPVDEGASASEGERMDTADREHRTD